VLASTPLELGPKADTHAWLDIDKPTVSWRECVSGRLELVGGRTLHRTTQPVEIRIFVDDHGELQSVMGQELIRDRYAVKPGRTRWFPSQAATRLRRPR